MDLLGALASNGMIRVETTLGPAIDIPLVNTGAEPSWLVQLLKPRVTFFEAGTPITSVSPAGDPSDSPPWAALAIAGIALLLILAGRSG